MATRRDGRKRRTPLGKPLPEANEETAVVKPEDIERARESWKKYAPPQYRDLLDAEVDSGEEFG